MRLFLDSSVVLAACGRPAGGSHAIFDLAGAQGWRLLTGDYVLREVERNVRDRLSASARGEWLLLRPKPAVVADELTHPWPAVFPAAKDRPVLFTAAAVADVLLTLDRADFGGRDGRGILRSAGDEAGRFLAARACCGPARSVKMP